MKNKKRNKFAPQIDASIDLHGLTEAAAISAVTLFLQKAESDESQRVRIITGKGSGVLQKSVSEWLRYKRYFFEHAKITEGGTGALVVTLY